MMAFSIIRLMYVKPFYFPSMSNFDKRDLEICFAITFVFFAVTYGISHFLL